eukprot:439445_1
MSSEFFGVQELCSTLISYLDYLSIISLDDSNICENDDVKVEDLFRSYLNEWEKRNALTAYFNDSGIFSSAGGHSKYTLFSVKYSKDIDDVNEDNLFNFLPQLAMRYTNRNTFDEVKCDYSHKNNKYEYSVMGSFAKLFENKKNEWMFRTDYMKQLKCESNQLPLLLEQINNYVIQNKFCDLSKRQQVINTIKNVLSIENNKKACSMIKKWYLFIINGQEDSNERYSSSRFDKYMICVYGHLDDKVLPLNFIKTINGDVDDDTDDDTDDSDENKPEFDTFITFQICIIDITYE